MRTLHASLDNQRADEEWRFDFQRVGDSVVIFRCDKKARNYYTDFREDFEAKMLRSKQDEFTSVDSFKLGPLNILQHAQVDCAEDAADKDDDLDKAISSLMSKVDINNNPPAMQKFAGSHLTFTRDGKGLELKKTVVLSTKSAGARRKFPNIKWAMMFFTQCDQLVIGWHHMSELIEIERLGFKEVSERCGQSKERVQCSVGKLVEFLQMVKLFAVNGPDGVRYSAVCEKGSSSIKVYRWWEEAQCLPVKLKKIIYT